MKKEKKWVSDGERGGDIIECICGRKITNSKLPAFISKGVCDRLLKDQKEFCINNMSVRLIRTTSYYVHLCIKRKKKDIEFVCYAQTRGNSFEYLLDYMNGEKTFTNENLPKKYKGLAKLAKHIYKSKNPQKASWQKKAVHP